MKRTQSIDSRLPTAGSRPCGDRDVNEVLSKIEPLQNRWMTAGYGEALSSAGVISRAERGPADDLSDEAVSWVCDSARDQAI